MLDATFARATVGPVATERTAGIVWEMLRALNRPIFLWNVFPLHPHAAGDHLTNRCHTRRERQACRPILLNLIELIQPNAIVAIGNDAEVGLRELGISAARVRHPSYGGKSDFVSGLARIYGVADPQKQASLSF
jgi:uracil-DNA glycosylase